MVLEEGDRISADARLVEGEELMMDVSVLTGESLPVARNPHPIGPRRVAAIRGEQTVLSHGETPLQGGGRKKARSFMAGHEWLECSRQKILPSR